MINHKIELALERLNSIFPLKKNQDECAPKIKQLHQHILRYFVTKGRFPYREEMSSQACDVAAGLNELHRRDMVTFSDNGEPNGVYPFTLRESEYVILVKEHTVYAMCALDALAIAPLFQEATQITSNCKITGELVKIHLLEETLRNIDEVKDVYFGISWSAANENSCCADSLCREMVFLRDLKTAEQWLADDVAEREIFTLPEAVQFASRFFIPLLA